MVLPLLMEQEIEGGHRLQWMKMSHLQPMSSRTSSKRQQPPRRSDSIQWQNLRKFTIHRERNCYATPIRFTVTGFVLLPVMLLTNGASLPFRQKTNMSIWIDSPLRGIKKPFSARRLSVGDYDYMQRSKQLQQNDILTISNSGQQELESCSY
jgi:hypothetical protein